jgi:choline kinase
MSLVGYTVDLLNSKGITDIAIVVGYRHQVVREKLTGRNVKFYYNPFCEVTNSVASAWFARDFLRGDDVMILNADVFAEPAVVDQVLRSRKDPVLFSDETRKEDADYKLGYENGILEKYGKELKGGDITGEYIGIARMSESMLPKFTAQMEAMIDRQEHGVWWENVLFALTEEMDIHVEDVGGKFWAEVDYLEDYERILKFRDYKISFTTSVEKICR